MDWDSSPFSNVTDFNYADEVQNEGDTIDLADLPSYNMETRASNTEIASDIDSGGLNHDWSFLHLREFMTFGLWESEMFEILNSSPMTISHIMKKALKMLQTLAVNRSKYLKDLHIPIGAAENMREEDGQEAFNNEMWEMDETFGIFQMAFVPETGLRKSVTFNSRYASLVSGMTREDLMSSYSLDRGLLPFSKSDLPLLLVDEILNDFQDRARFFRLIKRGEHSINAVLVCCAVSREFNSFAQLCKVCIQS
jgi:hypothetical protein